MIIDKEFFAFQDGIFNPYFKKYIEFKRGNEEKVSQLILVRLRGSNNSHYRYSSTLDLTVMPLN
jgi:integrase/recombinase XerD